MAMDDELGEAHRSRRCVELLDRIDSERMTQWAEVESSFLELLSQSDAAGPIDARDAHCCLEGWNEKMSECFGDVLASLLRNATGQPIGRGVNRDSDLFSEIDIGLCYPANEEDVPIVGADTKVLSMPPHSGSNSRALHTKHARQRVREIALTALTSFDFKAHYAEARRIDSFKSWIQETRPKYYSFWAFRVSDDADFETARSTMNSLRSYCNGVGAFFYRAKHPTTPTDYVVAEAPELTIDRALKEMQVVIAQDE